MLNQTSKYAKYGILFGLIVVMGGVAVTILLGYRPAPARIMKPSFFEKPEQIGAVALKRFYAPLAGEKVTVLGIPTNRDWSTEVVSGFLLAAQQNDRGYAHVIIEEKIVGPIQDEIRKIVPKLSALPTNTETLAELTEAIQTSVQSGERVLVVLPNLYSTHLLQGNTMSRLEKNVLATDESSGKASALFTISVGPLALEASQEKELDPVCIGSERDGSGTAEFGCAILQAGRFFYRKRILDTEPGARERFVALMQSPKPNDYLLLVREPRDYGIKKDVVK